MAAYYQIRIKDYLDAARSTRFSGLALSHAADGSSLLTGPIADQVALRHVLNEIFDQGLFLLAVTRLQEVDEDDEGV